MEGYSVRRPCETRLKIRIDHGLGVAFGEVTRGKSRVGWAGAASNTPASTCLYGRVTFEHATRFDWPLAVS